MTTVRDKKPLYRKVNTKAADVHHGFGGDYSRTRHARRETREQVFGSMHGRKRRGLDYTPLFRFLLSKVGSDWDEVYSEAVSRLDNPEPVFWLVALNREEGRETVCMSESSLYTGLYVDDDGILRVVNPDLTAEDIEPSCKCCTWTLNGVVVGKKG